MNTPVTRLGPGGEFDLIRRLTRDMPPLPEGVLVGPGDDAAVLDGDWVISSDLAVEGVHFLREWLTPAELGGRATAAALSDLAAMAAHPVALLLSMAAPPGDVSAVEALQRGAREMAEGFGAAIVGGDLSRSLGPLVVDVVVLGRTAAPVLRAGGGEGDELWVTGTLGGAGGAVQSWTGGGVPSPLLREAFVRPTPRLWEARWLAERGLLHAAIDLSDGLAGDAGHLAAASGLRVTLVEADLPLHPGLLSGDFSVAEARRLALEGGEDFELAFLAPPGRVAREMEDFVAAFGVPLTRVGWVEAGEGVALLPEDGGDPRDLGAGFSHFGERS